MRGLGRTILAVLGVLFAQAAPAAAQDGAFCALPAETRLSDTELAAITGKFVLPNGVEIALSVTSDTVVNGQLILRTVLTVDRSSQLQVFGRTQPGAGQNYVVGAGNASASTPSGVTVTLDRQSGLQTVTPTFSVRTPSVSVTGASTQDPKALGLTTLALTPGGPAVATADGVVTLESVRNGSQVMLTGDQMSVTNLVGQSIATALVNSANNRTLDSVTNVAIDLRNISAYQTGSAMMQAQTLALDATGGMVR